MMELILRENVPSLGKAGELVRVKPGYARNFLLPRGLAFEATEGNRKAIAAQQKANSARLAEERAAAQAVADRLASVTLEFSAKAGEDGKLFGSVTSADIADKLISLGHELDKRKIDLEHTLKQLGYHTVSIRLTSDVTADVKVNISAES